VVPFPSSLASLTGGDLQSYNFLAALTLLRKARAFLCSYIAKFAVDREADQQVREARESAGAQQVAE